MRALADQKEAERVASARLERQVESELRKLKQREQQVATRTVETPVRKRGRKNANSDFHQWLDRRKNLSGAALTEALGLVRMRTPDGDGRSVERADVERRLREGWLLD